jgi:hypothetical protein
MPPPASTNQNQPSSSTPVSGRADFADAHERHREDAERLYLEGRRANADHLYGIAAECGLKRLMLAFGMPSNNNTGSPQEKDDRVHVNEIWDRYRVYVRGKSAVNYCIHSNPFKDWEASQRYHHQAEFPTNRVDPHKEAVKRIHKLLRLAREEGRIKK